MKSTIAIAQFSPEVLNLSRSIDKLCKIISDAGKAGIQVLAFPETWLTVYPVWVDMGTFSKWGDENAKRLYARFYNSSIDTSSDEMKKILSACRKSGVFVVLGANERDGRSSTIFNSILYINGNGELVGVHRKLVPTFGERLIWGRGGSEGLKVHKTPHGNIGGLICWEHWMPPARQVLHEQRENIHVALWPHGKEHHQIASRHYAFEGRCFVLTAAMYLEKGMFPSDFELAEELLEQPSILLNGGSAIIAPDGSYIVEPLLGKEDFVVAEIDTEVAVQESLTLDVAGHYSRPDIFQLHVISVPEGIVRHEPPHQAED